MWATSSSSAADGAAGRVEVCLEINNCRKLLSPLGPEGQKEELGCKSRDLQELQPKWELPTGTWGRGGRTAGGSWNREEDTGDARRKPKAQRAEPPGPPVSLVFPRGQVYLNASGQGRAMQLAETGPCDGKQGGARAAVDLRPNEQMARLMA